MDFQKLVNIYEQLEKISSGNEIREILSDFFKQVPKDDIALVSYLTLGKLGSEFESPVLGLAEKSVVRSIAKVSGVSEKKVKEITQKRGDAGLAAEELLKKKPQTLIPVGKLSIHEFFDVLHKIANTSGSGSQDTKSNLLVGILQKVSPIGGKYLIRIVLGTLRMGVGEMTVLDSLAIAYTGEKKNKEYLEKAFNICPDVGEIAFIVASNGLKGLEKIRIHVGTPIKMMLAQRVQELTDLEKKMPGEVSVEGKYDGERIQCHKNKKGKIKLFSRRLDTITSQFPDLVKYLEKVKAKEFVIEGEVLAIDEKGKPLPFQTLMQRRRKHEIEKYVKDVPIILKVFDVLYVDGKSYLHSPYAERSIILDKIITGEKIIVADKIITSDLDKINDFFLKMLDQGYEGIMIKNLQGEYQAGTRGWNWIKWKKEYVKDMVDNFDLVIVGAYYGRGRRSGGYGALLCACYDAKNDEYLTLCKVGTGFTDEMLAALPKKLDKYKTENKPGLVRIKKEMEPDVWFEPKIVVEVLAAELTKSPYHTAGLALRFPRFIRIREDKKADQSTTLKEVKEIYGK
tara:strand:- start:49756 stop:51459 length:1704 start_codon:yes stop_codon:yes gene_type:complete